MSLDFNWNAYKQNTIIVGASQHGKTNLAKVLSKMLAIYHFNVVIFDVHRRFTNLDPSCVKSQLWQLTGKGLEIYQPPVVTLQVFVDFLAWVNTKKNLIVVGDELHNFCKKQKAPEELDYLCRNCNNNSVGYIFLFQAPAEVPGYVLRNSTHRFCYFLDVPTDIDYMKKFIGNEVKRYAADSNDPVPRYSGLYKQTGERTKEFRVDRYE